MICKTKATIEGHLSEKGIPYKNNERGLKNCVYYRISYCVRRRKGEGENILLPVAVVAVDNSERTDAINHLYLAQPSPSTDRQWDKNWRHRTFT